MRLGPIARACSKKWQGPFGVVCWFWVFSGCSIGQGQSLPPGTADLTSWVSQLGAGDFQTREKATDQLRKLGPEVLPALRSAMNSPDAEIRKRATDLVGELEKREWTRKALAPQLVTLKLNRATASEALAEYSKASGMRIDFADPRDRTAGKRLDLSLEKLPAWEALRLIKVGFDLREKQDTEPEDEPIDPNMWRRRPSRTIRGYFEPAPFRLQITPRPADEPPDWENTDLGVRTTLGKTTNGLKLVLHSQPDARILNLRGLAPLPEDKPGKSRLAWKFTPPSPAPMQQRRGAMLLPSSKAIPARQEAILELPPGFSGSGTVAGTAQIDLLQIDRPLIRIEDLAEAEGKSFEGRDGLKIEVRQAFEIRPGNFQVRFQVSPPQDSLGPDLIAGIPLPGIPAPGNPKPAMMPGLPVAQGPLILPGRQSINPAEFRFSLDGRPLNPTGSGVSTTVSPRGTSHELTFTFQSRALDGLGGVSVEWISQNVVSLEVPFEFRDVQLP